MNGCETQHQLHTHVQVRLPWSFVVCLSSSFMCTDVSISLRSVVLRFISISSRSSNLSQVSATGIWPRPSLHFLHSIHPSIPHHPTSPLSAVKVKLNWILPTPTRCSQLSVCLYVCVCKRIHGQIKLGFCLSVLLPWLHEKQQLCATIHVWDWIY